MIRNMFRTVFIPDPRLALPAPPLVLLLPAPQIAGLLPAWASPQPSPVSRPLAALKPDEEALLAGAYTHRQARDEARWHLGEDGEQWFPVGQHARAAAAVLVEYGYFARHPNKRRRMWYGLTEDGCQRARAALEAREAEEAPPAAIAQAMDLIARGLPVPGGNYEVLRWLRRRSLRRLARELGHRGFVLYHEAGRGPHLGEQAFYNVWTRQIALYRCKLGSDEWRLHRRYFKTEQSFSPAELEAHLAAIDF